MNENKCSCQLKYYVDRAISSAYYKPIFDLPIVSVGYVDYIDPMGSWKPSYSREATAKGNSNLSFINDTSFVREELMSRQTNLFNRTRSTPFL